MQPRESISVQLNKLLADSKNRSYFVGFITFVFLALFLLFGIIPVYSSVLSQIEENQKIEKTTQAAQKKLQEFQQMSDELKTNGNLLDYFQFIFPGTNRQEDLAEHIHDLANQNQIKINSMEFKKDAALQTDERIVPLTSHNVILYGMTLFVEGTKESGLDFLESLENSRRIIDITNISFSNEGAAEGDVYSIVVEFRYYIWTNFQQP